MEKLNKFIKSIDDIKSNIIAHTGSGKCKNISRLQKCLLFSAARSKN